MCYKPFPTIISRESQKPFRYCYACNKKHHESPDGTTIHPAARPSTQKQIQLAHAVLLATDPIVATPAAVAPPPYDTEYFNYNGLHLLSAKTPSTDPASTIASWLLRYMDSVASPHCTFDLLDTVDPFLLPEPLPIGSANGSIIYHLSPSSKIKLISLWALIRQGFTYSIGPHRAMTVLDSSGKHLCTCPPLLMAPPPSPTRRLLVAPVNPSFFIKEQVHRAVLCRQFHEFLCHPNDEALKTVLNQGTFAQYSPLVSADVDLMQSFFGSCVFCGVGMMHYQGLHSDSTSSPSAIGDQVFFNPYPLPCTTHGAR